MKCLLLRKWTVCFFIGLFLSSMLPGIQAKAAEIAEAESDNSGILQSGGLLQEEEALSPLRVRSSGNTAGMTPPTPNTVPITHWLKGLPSARDMGWPIRN